jgi:hypothetical protein
MFTKVVIYSILLCYFAWRPGAMEIIYMQCIMNFIYLTVLAGHM